MLKVNIKSAWGFDVNMIFIFNQMQRLSNIGVWREANVGLRRRLDFHFQPKCNIC